MGRSMVNGSTAIVAALLRQFAHWGTALRIARSGAVSFLQSRDRTQPPIGSPQRRQSVPHPPLVSLSEYPAGYVCRRVNKACLALNTPAAEHLSLIDDLAAPVRDVVVVDELQENTNSLLRMPPRHVFRRPLPPPGKFARPLHRPRRAQARCRRPGFSVLKCCRPNLSVSLFSSAPSGYRLASSFYPTHKS